MSSAPHNSGILWFRHNLRSFDNPPLLHAANNTHRLLCVFIYDEVVFYEQHGIQSLGPYRAQFLWDSLRELKSKLQALGNDLLILRGDADKVLKSLVDSTGIKQVYAQQESGYCEWEQEQAVAQFCDLELIDQDTLLNPDKMPMSASRIPNSFVLFRRQIERNWVDSEWHVADCLPAPEKLPPAPEHDIKSIEQNPAPESKAVHSKAVLDFCGGEDAGRQRLKHYVYESGALSHHKFRRNLALGSDYSSKLSPWLANGCVSVRELYHAVRQFEQNNGESESTEWMISELLWRDYFYLCARYHGADLYKLCGIQSRAKRDKSINFHKNDDAKRWANGETGHRLIDAYMTELKETGYMGNRGRQIVASYFTHELGLDWRLGASWFEHLLLDFNPSLNYGNWNYQAGIGHDNKAQTKFDYDELAQRFDSDGAYRQHWLG